VNHGLLQVRKTKWPRYGPNCSLLAILDPPPPRAPNKRMPCLHGWREGAVSGGQVSAQTILKSLVKNLGVDIAHEMEVVAGKYLIQDGTLKVSSLSSQSRDRFQSI